MPDFIRVADGDTGHELTVQRSQLAHGNFRELKGSDAVDVNGNPLPPKHGAHKSLSSTTEGQKATDNTTKE